MTLSYEHWVAVQAERLDHDLMYGVEYQSDEDAHQEWLDKDDRLREKTDFSPVAAGPSQEHRPAPRASTQPPATRVLASNTPLADLAPSSARGRERGSPSRAGA